MTHEDSMNFAFHADVRRALSAGLPVVALESTIISHGMKWPDNLHTALHVERVVRDGGAVPATVAILDGVVHVGLSTAQIERVARLGAACEKVSRRDIASAIARRANGATTVSGTMVVAHRAGIRVFVTGGIGGVHRGGELSMDVSADLAELARTPVAVVCAGIKSILDIARTVERLETDGVTLCVFGADEVPAFFTRHSGVPAPLRLDAERDIAQLLAANHRLALNSGVVVCVPIRAEDEADAAAVETATQQALREAEQKAVLGRDVTPYVLKRVAELTGGSSLAANIKLVLNNARIGSQIAVELCHALNATAAAPPQSRAPSVLVVGGAVADVISRPASTGAAAAADSKSAGVVQLTAGGVGRNIAALLGGLGVAVRLVSVVARDAVGEHVLQATRKSGVDVSAVSKLGGDRRTAVYSGVIGAAGDMASGVSDMGIFEALSAELVLPHIGADLKLVVLDGNPPQETIAAVCARCATVRVPVFFEATSQAKALKAVPVIDSIAVLSSNAHELHAIASRMFGDGLADAASVCATMVMQQTRVGVLLTSLGASGVQLATRTASGAVRLQRFPAPQVERVVSTNGAGDAFVGGFIEAHFARGLAPSDAVACGLGCAKRVLLGANSADKAKL
jgi:pseudouridine-5'-phosphate glycosidase/pseudouridine kinase